MFGIDRLKEFLMEAHAHTYAAGLGSRAETPCRAGSTDFHYGSDGEGFRYHDSYFGNRKFIGGEVVYSVGIPVWGMNYFGGIIDPDMDKGVVWSFLQKALKEGTENGECLRGPALWATEVLRYERWIEGDPLVSFTGSERIFFRDKLVYAGLFHGGSISE